jgi:hypothetical protein
MARGKWNFCRDEENPVCYFKDLSQQLLPYEECENGKLAVIEVVLANGKIWKLVP